MKRIYVAATQQHDGKTTTCVGLYAAALNRGHTAAFIKPVGQHYQIEEGVKVDEDAVLFKHGMSAPGSVHSMSPVIIPRGFTEEYIFNRDPHRIEREIQEGFDQVTEGKEVAVIEGTGHAGVGSVIDASNARVARFLEADCIIISKGGIGRCIDEIALNRALFEREGVRCLGAIINKVWTEKYDRIEKAVRQGLKNVGIECLGVVPYREELTFPTMAQVHLGLDLEVLSGEEHLEHHVRKIIVAAMEPQNMIEYLEDGSLVIVPGDRVGNILTSITAHLMQQGNGRRHMSGLLLTGGLTPPESVRKLMGRVDVPVLLSEEDTATAAYKARRLVAKIRPDEPEKLKLAGGLVRDYVDVDRILGEAS